MNQSIVEVSFKIYAKVKFGEEVRISGNVPALGCNNPKRAVALKTTPNEFPWWTSKESIFLPGGENEVRYRYCIFSGGQFNRWEGDFMRTLDVSKANEFSLATTDSFGDFESRNIPFTPSSSATSYTKSSDAHTIKARQLFEWNQKSRMDTNLSENDGVVIVSYFLPVVISRTEDGKWSATWDRENILSLNLNTRAVWVGSVRYKGGPIPTDEEDAVAFALSKLNCYPVFINQQTHHTFYDIYCKKHLWLLMHHIADVYGPLDVSEIGAKSQQDEWFTFSTVNNLFRNKLIEVYQSGDIIWIHGFHLMLLPSILRRRLHSAKIGYFFHTPFPSSEIWRTITRRQELLRGILAADFIGFHLYEYARHFLTSCHRLLGYSYGMNPAGTMTVDVDGREVAISCMHIGVDLPRVQEIMSGAPFFDERNNWKKNFGDKIVVSGIDRLERLKGVPLKLFAIDEFLSENAQWKDKLLFAFVGITAHERGADYLQTLHDVRILVNRINKKHGNGSDIIIFEERSEKDMTLPRRLAFFSAADILMVTATRDGLNRFPMEFTLAKQNILTDASTQRPGNFAGEGLVIVSEFISSVRVLRGAFIVNPWKMDELKNALLNALEVSLTEKEDRFRRNLEFSTRLTTNTWANQVLSDIKSIVKSDNPHSTCSLGFGTGFRVMRIRADFQGLDSKEVMKNYRIARNRLILLDWGGTLVAEHDKNDKVHAYALAQGHTSRSGPTQALKQLLTSLCQDPKNNIFVVSGKDLKAVSDFFGDVPNLGLAAEHGCYYKWPRDESVDRKGFNGLKSKWQTMLPSGDQTWKDAASKVMDIYVQRTHGTYIERKGNALIWQFRDADPEFGFLQSKELEEHLLDIMSGYPVEVLRGGGVSDGYIEVRPAGLSKGMFLLHALETMKSLRKYADFVLCIGDDNSDEPMFEEINRIKRNNDDLAAFGVTVGMKPSSAQSYLNDPQSVMELLTALNRQSVAQTTHFSTFDLQSHANLFESEISRQQPLGFSTRNRSYADFQTASVESSTFRAGNTGDDMFVQQQQVEHVPLQSPSQDAYMGAHVSMAQYQSALNDDQENFF